MTIIEEKGEDEIVKLNTGERTVLKSCVREGKRRKAGHHHIGWPNKREERGEDECTKGEQC